MIEKRKKKKTDVKSSISRRRISIIKQRRTGKRRQSMSSRTINPITQTPTPTNVPRGINRRRKSSDSFESRIGMNKVYSKEGSITQNNLILRR